MPSIICTYFLFSILSISFFKNLKTNTFTFSIRVKQKQWNYFHYLVAIVLSKNHDLKFGWYEWSILVADLVYGQYPFFHVQRVKKDFPGNF